MTNRRHKFCFLAVAAMVLSFSLFVVIVYRDPWATPIDPMVVYDEIPIGGSAAHAVSLFQLPPGDYRTNSRVVYHTTKTHDIIDGHPSWQQLTWGFDECEVAVFLDEDGVIVAKQRTLGHNIDRPFWVVVKDFFRL